MPARKLPDPNADDEAKIERFKALAREIECDEDPAAIEASLRTLAGSKPLPKHEPKKRKLKE